MSDTASRTLNVVFAITQALVPALPALGYGITVGARDGFASPPEVPAGYAFSIWGLIFLLSLIYAVVQVLPSARQAPVYQNIATASWLLFALSTTWMLIAQFDGPTAALAVVIVIMLALALSILARVAAAGGGPGRLLLMALFGLYAGWLSLAAFLNLSSLLRETGLAPLGLADWQYAIGVLIAGGILVALMLLRTHGQLWYLAAAVWGLVAVVVQNMQAGTPETYVAAAAAALSGVLIGLTAILRRSA
jgi:hypothetical protein